MDKNETNKNRNRKRQGVQVPVDRRRVPAGEKRPAARQDMRKRGYDEAGAGRVRQPVDAARQGRQRRPLDEAAAGRVRPPQKNAAGERIRPPQKNAAGERVRPPQRKNAVRSENRPQDMRRRKQSELAGNRPKNGHKKSARRKNERRPLTPEQLERARREAERKQERRRKRLRRAAAMAGVLFKILLVLAILSAIAFLYIKSSYKLKNAVVNGTSHYTDEEIVDIVSGGKSYGNTLMFLVGVKLHPVKDVTFIDKIDVEYVDKNSVSITVYEKAMAGCIEYDGQYAYFDGDGTVLEISSEKLADVPCIEGLEGDSVEQGKKLGVGDESLFQEILTITQLIYKNNIAIDRITYDDSHTLVLHKGDIQIELGSSGNLESKFMNLQGILSKLDGKKGTLDMSGYTDAEGNAIFKENK